MHARLIFDLELRESIADSLLTRYWVILENPTAIPFYTSDHPVVHKGYAEHRWRSMQGLCCPGVEIAFPLSSRYLLTILDPEHFPGAGQFHMGRLTARQEHVEHYNSLQVLFAHQQLYACVAEFDLVREMVEEDQETGDPARRRVEIQRGDEIFANGDPGLTT